MADVHHFGLILLGVSAAIGAAVAANRLASRVPIPGPALFLVAAALVSDLFPSLESALSIRTVTRIGTVALIVILFDGGLQLGWRSVRGSAWPTLSLGVLGTFATAGVMACAAHLLFGFSWIAAGILGAAVAPTDPAVMFSVLGNREAGGRAGTILKAESGANDPVGIALMIGMIELATHSDGSFWIVVREFGLQMGVGGVVGIAAAILARPILRTALPNDALYPLRALALSGVIYGAAAAAHGSGFLAVFVAAVGLGDARIREGFEVERFLTSLAALAEILVFVALGLSVQVAALGAHHLWAKGLALAFILTFVARPAAAAVLLGGTRLGSRERAFVMWGGLKGAVPILLAALAVLEGVERARDLYGIVFVVVAFSVVVQGTSLPAVAARLGLPLERSPSG